MATSDRGQSTRDSAASYTKNIRRPNAERNRKIRFALLILFVIALPPFAVLYLWRTGTFTARGRVILTGVAAVALSLMILPMLPEPRPLNTVRPVPGIPVSATHAPESEILTALSNIEQELAAAQAQNAQPTSTPAPVQQDGPSDEEILATIVYSVNNGARYYHAAPTCEDQRNARALTVEEALAEFLGACAKCNPPTL